MNCDWVNRCYVGDTRDGMRAMIAAGVKVQTVCTSPPFWGLRDYGTAQWDGGEAGCDHMREGTRSGAASTLRNDGRQHVGAYEGERNLTVGYPYRELCGKCGALRVDRQLGLESTPSEYVANMVDVFRLVRDLLADDGTLWLNLGDSYAGGGFAGSEKALSGKQGTNRGSANMIGRALEHGLKPKDLVGIPWRVAFALQADGWYLRSDIIWHKPNPMPESVTDRPTKAHEYLFLLTKAERYYYDAAAIAEQASNDSHGALFGDPGSKARATGNHSGPLGLVSADGKRNRRTVWTVATQPYSEAHFATFPRALIEPCILAGSRPGDVVFDPFLGSGTTAQVAQDLGRQWIGCELNPAYVDLQSRRAAQLGMALA